MLLSPIRRVLSSMQQHHVRCLLTGGRACVFYGAAEFSRDVDLAIIADSENPARLRAALHHLAGQAVGVPPFERRYLEMGLVVHLRGRLQ